MDNFKPSDFGIDVECSDTTTETLVDLYLGIAVVIATLLGPVLAVWVTRHNDETRQIRERRMNVFRALMATRRATLAAERVTALNMVEIEFHGVAPVENAYRDVMRHINHARPLPQNWGSEQLKLVTRLMSEIGKSLGYELQQLDMLDGGYYPEGLADIEAEQQAVRRAIIETLCGNRPLRVSPAAPAPPAPFPPPPEPAKDHT